MKDKLRNFFLKDPTNWKFWLALALVFKGILFFLRVIQGSDDPFVVHGFWGYMTPDSSSYILPIENLLTSGNYGAAMRVPGYGAIYFLFRLFCSQAIACNMIILLQYILASVSVYCLAALVQGITKSRQLFYTVFYLFLVSSYSNYMDAALMTESFCTSVLIFSTYFFVSYFRNKQAKHLFFSGALLTWAVFLRPVFLPVILFYALFLGYQLYKDRQSVMKALLIFILPFVIVDGMWIARNYPVYKKIVPLTPSVWSMFIGAEWQYPAVVFIQSWGGEYAPGSDKSLLYWFGYRNPYVAKFNGGADPIPDYVYTSKFNKDSLLKLKQLFTSLEDSAISAPDKENSPQAKLIVSKFNEYTASIKAEKPFLYYVKAPLIYLKDFFVFKWASYNVMGYAAYHKGIFKYYNNLNYVAIKLFKVNPIDRLYMIFDYLILLFGVLGGFLMLKESFKNAFLLVLIAIPAYTIVVHPFLLRLMINRYLMPAWPFIIVCAAWFIITVREKFYSKKLQ